MSLTLPSNYEKSSKLGNIVENWIVQLFYDDESANDFTPIALSNTIVENVFYHGVITNEPTIRTSVNVFRSKASTSQISLNIINFDYKGSSFSEELLYGTRSYINRTVKIFSQLNSATAIADCLQIFHGRFVDISHDNEKITLSIVEQRPWDFIEIPNQRTVTTNNQLGIPTYFPVAYGAYSANISFQDNERLCHARVSGQDTSLYPIPVHTYDSETFTCLASESDTGNTANEASSVTPHFYEPNIDSFIPLLNSSGSTFAQDTITYQGGNAIKAPLNMFRAFRFKPTDVGDSNTFTVGNSGFDAFDTSSGASSTDLNSTTVANHPPAIASDGISLPSNTTHSESNIGQFNFPSIDGKITFLKVKLRGFATITALGTNITRLLTVKANDFHGSNIGMTDDSGNVITSITSGATTAGQIFSQSFGTTGAGSASSGSLGTFTSQDLVAQDSTNFAPENLTIRCSYDWQVGESNLKAGAQGICYISDIQYVVRSKLIFDSTNQSANIEKLNKIKMLYTGADGLNKSYTGGSGTATTGIEAHRDMLFRFAGFDASDSNLYNWGTSNPSSNSLNINSARSNWTIAFWQLEPRPLLEILDQLQYEMGFWFKYRADGSGAYYYVKNSYASSDVSKTLKKSDIDNISIKNTNWKNLITQYDVEFKRHPANNSRYIESLSSSDSTNNFRSAYNIQSKENKKHVKLDMNIGAIGASDVGASGQNPNDGFTNYYLYLSGRVRKIISFDLVNPAIGYGLETGDIIQFSAVDGEMPVKPFGHDWNQSGSQYYMITELQRQRGKIKIKTLEVG